MFSQIRQHWDDFQASSPGKRFQDIHKRRRTKGKNSAVKKWSLMIVGLLLTIAGLFFLAAPGPGTIVLAVGLVLIAGESLTMAKFLDWLELKLRPLYLWAKRKWAKATPRARMTLLASLSLLGLAAAITALLVFVR